MSSTKHKIFLIFVFLEPALLFAVPAIPYDYIINLFYNNVKRKKEKIIKYLIILFYAENIKSYQIIKYLIFLAIFISKQYIEGKCYFL